MQNENICAFVVPRSSYLNLLDGPKKVILTEIQCFRLLTNKFVSFSHDFRRIYFLRGLRIADGNFCDSDFMQNS